MLVQVRGVRLSFDGTPVLQDLALELARGEILALVGRSGQGKTTILRMLMGELAPDKGDILIQGQRMSGEESQWHQVRGAIVAPIFQMARDGLSPLRSLGAQIGDALSAAGRAPDEVDAFLAQVGLGPEVAKLRLDQVSGGMAQRVAIARALARGARVILADEPTSALDHEASGLVMQALRGAASAGCAVLLVTHDLQIARQADRIAILEGGRIVEQGGMRVLSQPQHPVTQAICDAERQMQSPKVALPAPEVLRFENLGHRFTAGAGVFGASGALAEGECLAILGPSGAGKTTLARMLAKVLAVQQGTICLQGNLIGQISPRAFAKTDMRARIQMVFQEARASFDPDVCVGQGMAQRNRALWAKRLGVDLGLLGRKPAEVSVGQAQRLALLRAVLEQPKVLILDEPTAALDMIGRAEVAGLLAQLKAEGMALILVAHDLALARGLADRLAYCRAGRLEPWEVPLGG